MSNKAEIDKFVVDLAVILRHLNQVEIQYAHAIGGSLTIEEPELFSASCHIDSARWEIIQAIGVMGKRNENIKNGVQDV